MPGNAAGATLLFSALIVSDLPASAQLIVGIVQGKVTDSSGAVVPGVDLTIVNRDTNFVIRQKSSPEGTCIFNNVPPGTAIRVDRNGGYTVEPGYCYFKPVSRTGHPGMPVAEVLSTNPDVQLIASAANGSRHPDAFVVVNSGGRNRDLSILPAHGGSDRAPRLPGNHGADRFRDRILRGAVEFDMRSNLPIAVRAS